ncbi:fructose-2,6-bisphosphatase TIGAR-like [Dendronephthya gigantea]|uniref:fructose-2,6-bisphosphatase TIGAR-like n=1 Tax=Dendronephthya gigantea TaxID=151771 RepID=UPI00106B4208|nr:fructose-2,6-bisphosphatase TIGAR-like [Dendronephthya gigantea]
MASVEDEWRFRLTLIRHGETDQNRNKIIQGQDNTILNETGSEQVELVATRLKYEHLTRIYSSDLERALKTAEGICLKNVHLKDLKICMEKTLRERNYGEAEGKSRQELKKMLGANKLPRGAETEAQVQKRAVDFFAGLLKDVKHLRKTLTQQSNVDCSKSDDLSLENSQHSMGESSVNELRTGSDPSSEKSHQFPQDNNESTEGIKPRTTSLPTSHRSKQLHSPVLLKDLCCNDSAECDHTDKPIHIVVVSHGGILRHFMSYFSKNFSSQFPVDKKKLLRQICPNTGVSEFVILLEGDKVTNIECLQLYNKSHLT